MTTVSRRLRVRLGAREDRELHSSTLKSQHPSLAAAARKALQVYEALRTALAEGNRVVLRNEQLRQQHGIVFPLECSSRECAPSFRTFEMRLNDEDALRMERLLDAKAASTRSQIMRISLKIFSDLVEKLASGWTIFLQTPSGDEVSFSDPILLGS